ncbi:MAG: DNA gyrase subunit A [Omnitrophica bacterium RBG_13_46_9]|nr:MAG: DNA gyrase subunit A [Omnitrophica bacterium RBG_13_46_9]
MYTRNEKVVPVHIEEEMKDSYINYAMSVIVGRALPDVRDGLKPVHRRILYAMRDLNLEYGKAYKKSARIVGEVLGKYHPHGDMAVYDTLVRMVQDFSLRYPLVDGQGNFGSIDGDAPAAMRYTEARLHSITDWLLEDLEKNTVDFVPNFDNSLKEPSILPATMPNLILNGSSGIAVGMATNIPPHNLTEVVEGITYLIDNPDCDIKDLMKKITGPDFPTGGIICGKDGIKRAYETGRGRLLVHAKAFVESLKGGKENIIITEIPYQVNKNNLISSIVTLVQERKIEGIADLRDESDKEGMRVVVELKRGQNAQVVLNQLYKHTQMQTTYGVIMLALVNSRPQVLNLKEILSLYVDYRKQVIVKRTKYDMEKAEARAHILEGLKIAIKNLDRVISIIRKSKDPGTAKEELMKKFKLSDKQAQAILEMQLQRLTNLERAKIDKEYIELIKKIELLRSILASEKKILEIIKEELSELNKKFGDQRRTQLMAAVEELEMEDLIQEEDVVITISHSGYIKRLPIGAYRKQKRGGKGVSGAEMREEDFIEDLYIASTHDNLLFFTNKGKAYALKVYDIPQSGRTAKGKAIVNLLSLEQGEQITSSISVKDFEEGKFLMMMTQTGRVKKTKLSAFANIRKSGIIAISLGKDDNLISAKLTSGKDEVFIATKDGKAIRFSEDNIRDMGRSAAGVRGINLGKKDVVVGMEVITDKKTALLAVTENGFSKRTEAQEYRVQSRGGKGVINIKVTEKNGPVIGLNLASDADDIMIITSKGMVVRCAVKDIRSTGRSSQGVRIIKLEKADKVASVARLVKEEEE